MNETASPNEVVLEKRSPASALRYWAERVETMGNDATRVTEPVDGMGLITLAMHLRDIADAVDESAAPVEPQPEARPGLNASEEATITFWRTTLDGRSRADDLFAVIDRLVGAQPEEGR